MKYVSMLKRMVILQKALSKGLNLSLEHYSKDEIAKAEDIEKICDEIYDKIANIKLQLRLYMFSSKVHYHQCKLAAELLGIRHI